MFFSVGVLAGDILIHLFRYEIFGPIFFLFVAIVLLLFAIRISRRWVVILAFFAGVSLISFRAAPDFMAIKTFENFFGDLSDQESITAVVSGKILKDPDLDGDKTALVLTDLNINGADYAGKVYTKFTNAIETESPLKRSDRVKLEGTLLNGFGTYLAYLYRPKIKSVTRSESGDFFLNLRDDLAKQIKKYLPKKEAGLALGYLLGMRQGVDKDFEETLRVVGLTHILVASGTHLSILVSFAKKIFGKISRTLGFFGGSIFALIFVGITGLTPSMSRAAPVAILGLVAWYLGRDRSPFRVLLVVMAGTLILNPTNLLDLAWLLSFGSFGGIMIVPPIIKNILFSKTHPPGFLAELIIASFSATLVCAPILIYFFGSISLISILANLLILPTISIVMGLTFLTGIFASFCSLLGAGNAGGSLTAPLEWVANLLGMATKILVDYHFFVVDFLGEQNYFLIKMEAGNPIVFLLYLALIPLGVVGVKGHLRAQAIGKSNI